MVETEETEAVSVTVATKLAWPKALPEQVKLVRSLLTQSRTLNELNQQFKTKPKVLEQVLETLCVLGNVQFEQNSYRLI